MKNEEAVLVSAYCRVSTDRGEQAGSFDHQMRFFEEYIGSREGWRLHRIYADEGITGTSVKKRRGFREMLCDAEKGLFSLLLTKEISRFARNLLDSIYYTRELKRLGVGVIFLSDGIDTRDADAELRLAILSSVAQEESRRTSERVKWGQKRSMEEGVVFGRSMLGYDVANGEMIVNDAGADIVRCIFSLCREKRMGASAIASELERQGISPPRGGKWHPSVVLRILKNEKYCGDLVQKKTVTMDYLTHMKQKNRGEEPLVILRDHHEPIISREAFDEVQAMLTRRADGKKREKRSEVHPFSGKIRCGICGRLLSARVREVREGRVLLWRCRGEHGANSVRDDSIREMMRALAEAEKEAFLQAKGELLQELSVLFGEGERQKARGRLLLLYLHGEMERDEYLEAKAMLLQEERQGEALALAIDEAMRDDRFFRALTREIEFFGDRAVVHLWETERVYEFDITKVGRRCEVRMRGK